MSPHHRFTEPEPVTRAATAAAVAGSRRARGSLGGGLALCGPADRACRKVPTYHPSPENRLERLTGAAPEPLSPPSRAPEPLGEPLSPCEPLSLSGSVTGLAEPLRAAQGPLARACRPAHRGRGPVALLAEPLAAAVSPEPLSAQGEPTEPEPTAAAVGSPCVGRARGFAQGPTRASANPDFSCTSDPTIFHRSES